MCLLAAISEEPGYGYELTRKLAGRGLDLASEGTIYPVLSRLQRHGLVEGYLVASPEGPARKYYRITRAGTGTLGQWAEDWSRLVKGVDRILKGGSGA